MTIDTHSSPAPKRAGFDRAADITARGKFSKTHLYNLLNRGEFPQPAVRNGPRFTRWRAADVDAWFADPAGWIAQRVAERDTAQCEATANG